MSAQKTWSRSTKRMVVKAAFGLFLLSVAPLPTSSQCRPDVYNANEVLRYAVQWGFIRIGTVEIRQQCVDPERNTHLLTMLVRSADNLPFIDIRFENRSIHLPHRHGLVHETIITGADTSEYRYDPIRGEFLTEDREEGVVVRRDTVKSDGPMFDALGLFMIARCFSGAAFDTTLKTLLEHRVYETDLCSTGEVEQVEVDAFSVERSAVIVKGHAKWVGRSYGGMTGEITGWISNDMRAIPLKAKVAIFLGFIVLELESYSRDSGTLPPSVTLNDPLTAHPAEGEKP